MASTVPNATASSALGRLVSGRTVKCVLLTGTTTGWNVAATARDMQYASSITADEMAHASYSRVAVSGLASTTDNTNDRGELDASDVTFPSLSGSAVVGVAFIEDTGSDATSPILSLHDCTATPATPTGADFVVRLGADGFIHGTT